VTRAVVLAALAGALAAPGVVELALTTRRPRARILARIGRGFGSPAPRGLEARIAAAGLDRPFADVMAVKAGAAVAGLAVGVALLPLAPGRTALLILIAAPAAGYLAPDAQLRRRTRRRTRTIEAELADVLDLLRVAVAAGLAPGARSPRSAAAIPACWRPSSTAPPRRPRSASPARAPTTSSSAARPPPACPRSSRPSAARIATARRSAPRWPPRRAPPAPARRSGARRPRRRRRR
jgi:hypothetical protein